MPARAVVIAPPTVELSTSSERPVGLDDRFRCRTFIWRDCLGDLASARVLGAGRLLGRECDHGLV